MHTLPEVREFVLLHVRGASGLADLSPDDHLLDSGVLDSLSLLRLVGAIEKRFGCSVRDEDIVPDNFATVSSISLLVVGRDE